MVVLYLYVSGAASKERKKFDNQLPEVLTLLATSLRAGYSIMQAIEAVAAEAPEPSNREFGQAMAEIRLGRPMIDALGDIAVRMESQDFEWTVMAIAIQREVGGNLAEVLQSTAETMLFRNRFRREVKALTAEGRSRCTSCWAAVRHCFGHLLPQPWLPRSAVHNCPGDRGDDHCLGHDAHWCLIMRKIVDIEV